ncbi:MAG: RNA-binding transcriptional accessory protein [Bacteroidales bacterium]|nr:RNA-binding transcriptional accessory protein [Bacteroidales bacterium]
MENSIIEKISEELGISFRQVSNTTKLLEDGGTIPFIARYRKEITQGLDEVQVTDIRDSLERIIELEKRMASIKASVKEQGKLSKELEEQIDNADTLTELEDIYLPFRPKRKTRASIAKRRGLEPLAKVILHNKYVNIDAVVNEYIKVENEIHTAEDALNGARDIIAEWISENKSARAKIRGIFLKEAFIRSKVIKKKEEEGEKYKSYFGWEEKLSKAPSHRILAMMRGENESFLRLSISPSIENAIEILENQFVKKDYNGTEHIKIAVKDSYKRLLSPSMENEMRQWAKEKADLAAIRVFADNLRQLLLESPLGQKNILAIDPGFKSGCKLVCLDKLGKLLHNETIFPHPPQREAKLAIHKIKSLVDAYKIDAIAIGNGTGGRETENLIGRIRFDKDVIAIMVNENGASVYSASAIAREEFPSYDVTVRGAVSIGRRLMDPLAELVKIDPKSIGVGQYQHDVNQTGLQKSLEDVVVSCVNQVGVDVNTASKDLLTYVSGMGQVLAKNVIEHRNKKGVFKSKEELKKVTRFGDKAFELAAGFLRISNAKNPLDRSAVHPESYEVVNKMTKKYKCTIDDIISNQELRSGIKLDDFITEKVGLPTLKDIMAELAKPGRDPRKKFDFFEFDARVNSIKDLLPAMVLPGIVTNITAFGAFVDIGVHQDGLVHISQLANKFVSDPQTVVNINQKVIVKVLEVDVDRKRIQLSMKDVS